MLSAASTLPMKRTQEKTHYKLLLDELRAARIDAGISQTDLAGALGQPQSFVSKCERGERRLDVIELRSWVLALGGDPVAFFSALDDRLKGNAIPVQQEAPRLGSRRHQ